MRIHNIMEDIATEKIDEIFLEEESRDAKQFCTCHQCRLDVVCFVLNRMRPYYAVSGRGLTHMKMEYQEKLQREADLVTLVHQGIKQISQHQRPNFGHGNEKEVVVPHGYFYNFPQIMGRIFNSVNFEPLSNITVSLFKGDTLIRMTNPNWQNPCHIHAKTPGLYSFWPYPIAAEKPNIERSFQFEVAVDDPDFAPLRHHFHIMASAEDQFHNQVQLSRLMELDDLYLVPVE